MIRRTVAVLTALSLPALAACGGGAPSKSEFLGKADPICKRGNELAAVATTPTDLPGVKDFLAKLADNADKTTREIEELDYPGGDDGDAAKAWVQSMKDAAAAARAVGGDVDAANFTAVEDNAKKAADAFKNADTQARAYGSTECGRGEAEATGRMQTALGATVKNGYIAKVDALCSAARKQVEAIPEPEESPQSITAYFDKVIPLGEKLVADIKAIPAPRTDKDKLDEWLTLQESTLANGKEVRAAAAAQDEEKFESSLEKSLTMSVTAGGKASAYGFKECGKLDA